MKEIPMFKIFYVNKTKNGVLEITQITNYIFDFKQHGIIRIMRKIYDIGPFSTNFLYNTIFYRIFP